MKPSDKQLAAGTLAFNECDIVSTPHCISAAYDAMTEVMTVEDVPERVRREIENKLLCSLESDMVIEADDLNDCLIIVRHEKGIRGGK